MISLITSSTTEPSTSAVFRTRTSSIIYKNYIEKKEGMGQLGK